jgi:hypothetical protein
VNIKVAYHETQRSRARGGWLGWEKENYTVVRGTWPSGQNGALTCRRSQVRAPAVAGSRLFVLACCWPSFPATAKEQYVSDLLLTALLLRRLEPPSIDSIGLGRRYANPQCHHVSSVSLEHWHLDISDGEALRVSGFGYTHDTIYFTLIDAIWKNQLL